MPKWVDKVMPAQTLKRTYIKAHVDRQDRGFRKTASGDEIRAFCKSCNNGWMSKLEEAAAPIIRPMILGHGITLDRNAQVTVASWMVKTCLVQRAGEENWQDLLQLYRAFFETRLPPERHYIAIGGCQGVAPKTLFHFVPVKMRVKDTGSGPSEIVDGYFATAAIAHFVGHVAHLPLFGKVVLPPKLSLIWPYVADLAWPQRFLDRAELQALAEPNIPVWGGGEQPQLNWNV